MWQQTCFQNQQKQPKVLNCLKFCNGFQTSSAIFHERGMSWFGSHSNCNLWDWTENFRFLMNCKFCAFPCSKYRMAKNFSAIWACCIAKNSFRPLWCNSRMLVNKGLWNKVQYLALSIFFQVPVMRHFDSLFRLLRSSYYDLWLHINPSILNSVWSRRIGFFLGGGEGEGSFRHRMNDRH